MPSNGRFQETVNSFGTTEIESDAEQQLSDGRHPKPDSPLPAPNGTEIGFHFDRAKVISTTSSGVEKDWLVTRCELGVAPYSHLYRLLESTYVAVEFAQVIIGHVEDRLIHEGVQMYVFRCH